jgi:hypothetical protein
MLGPAESLGGDLLQRYFDHDLIEQDLGSDWLGVDTAIVASRDGSFQLAGYTWTGRC